ncbi:hypothetical protein So717_42330 [Roseobacter cerasinus]|uniref:Acyltransferase n=1 Tax=Roseobacter cerasinus TaxID=2602289 RepID=A0A640VYL5_9RHOB|nr:acyltransferase family protein [Roseobacter cerasinus]GFE52480.1 hypothetical protein So717_42330 [Roseobacter cerasinus]
MRYRPEIDGLRAVAVLSVIFYHAELAPFHGGFVGVDVFFVLSGYLITALMLKDMARNRFSLWQFYERRARRILPALTVVALVSIPFAWALMVPSQLIDFAQSLIAVATFSSNILFLRESGYFEGASELKPLLHTWSLAVEEQFYLFFPLLLMALWRLGPARLGLVVALIAAVSLGASEWGWRTIPDANFYLLPFRAWELLAGSLCAFALRDTSPRRHDPAAALGVGMILLAVLLYDTATPVPSLYMLLPVVGTCLVILCAAEGTRVAAALSHRWMVGIGLISYSAYLWHQPLFVFARLQLWVLPTPVMMLGLSLVSLGLGWLSWKYIEQPFRGPDARLATRARVFAASGVAGVALLIFGFVGYGAGGFPQRLPDAYGARQATLEAEWRDRQDAVWAGTCHFNKRGAFGELPDFLDQWNCIPPGDDLTRPRLVVYGDSLAADIASALTQQNIDHLQLTGASCALALDDTEEPPYCKALKERLKVHLRAGDWLLLANSYAPTEIQGAYLDRVVADWSARADKLLLFTPRPEYPQLKQRFLWFGEDRLAQTTPDMHKALLFSASMSETRPPTNVHILDSAGLICAGRVPCSPVTDGKLLYIDKEHFTNGAARSFGAELIPELQRLGWTQ